MKELSATKDAFSAAFEFPSPCGGNNEIDVAWRQVGDCHGKFPSPCGEK